MHLIRGIHNIRPQHQGCVVTIGNFDGIHLGHQAIIGQLVDKAGELNLPSLLMLFEPQPMEFFSQNAPSRLTRFREKMQILRRFALDRVLCVQFNQNFASMNAEDFIHDILIAKLDVKYLGIGDDFKFGKQRLGDFKMLSHAGKEHGFQVASMHSFIIDGERVSSTRIRDALINGHFDLAEKLLGRPYRMCGRVAHGDKRGRILGFPTANIYVHRKLTPVSGVFAVEMFGLHGEPLAGVANVGIRPTVNGKKCILEVHLLNYNNDIYGKYVHVNFLKKLRSEIRFDSIEELKHQIEQDKVEAERFFTNRK